MDGIYVTWQRDGNLDLSRIVHTTTAKCPALPIVLHRQECQEALELHITRASELADVDQVSITSTARSYELSVQCLGERQLSYVSTTRGVPPDKLGSTQECSPGCSFQANFAILRDHPSWQRLRLRLLSLAGCKDTCTIHGVWLLPAPISNSRSSVQNEQHDVTHPTGYEAIQHIGPEVKNEGAAFSTGPTTVGAAPALSQMEQMKLLLQYAIQPGGSSAALPVSLNALAQRVDAGQTDSRFAAMSTLMGALARSSMTQAPTTDSYTAMLPELGNLAANQCSAKGCTAASIKSALTADLAGGLTTERSSCPAAVANASTAGSGLGCRLAGNNSLVQEAASCQQQQACAEQPAPALSAYFTDLEAALAARMKQLEATVAAALSRLEHTVDAQLATLGTLCAHMAAADKRREAQHLAIVLRLESACKEMLHEHRAAEQEVAE